MGWLLLANLTLLIHLAFVLFVAVGAFLALKWPRILWLQVPAAAWGAYIELSAGICPLTPLENHFIRVAGASGYSGGFVQHYLYPVLYPQQLSVPDQWFIGALVILVNCSLYAVIWNRRSNNPRH